MDEPDYSEYKSEDRDWDYVFGDIQEEIPNNMPKTKRRNATLTMFADANLCHDRLTGRSVTGLIMM